MSESLNPILVVGGTGRHGGTGACVARQLLKLGIPVRALVRERDDRAKAREEIGAKVVVGDFAIAGISSPRWKEPLLPILHTPSRAESLMLPATSLLPRVRRG